MKTKAVIIALFLIVIIVAICTKPNNKTIIIDSVKAVWGPVMPAENMSPEYYEQFMDLNSKSVYINDWLVMKRIQYNFGKETRTIGYAAFGKVMIRK